MCLYFSPLIPKQLEDTYNFGAQQKLKLKLIWESCYLSRFFHRQKSLCLCQEIDMKLTQRRKDYYIQFKLFSYVTLKAHSSSLIEHENRY